MEIVLDKSYLHGAGAKKIANLCNSYQVLMPEALFYELLTTEPDKRIKCFSNLPKIENPLMLVKNVGAILRMEVEKGVPFTDIKNASINIRYYFNRNLTNPDFKYTCQQNHTISEWTKDISSRIEDFKQKAAVVSGWFPGLKGYKENSDPQLIEEAKQLVCRKPEIIKAIYDQIRSQNFPPTEVVNENWALFREIQVYLMAALDYVKIYGDNNPESISKRIENEYLDLEYCITALLVGALASRDRIMVKRFKSIKPNGFVVQ